MLQCKVVGYVRRQHGRGLRRLHGLGASAAPSLIPLTFAAGLVIPALSSTRRTGGSFICFSVYAMSTGSSGCGSRPAQVSTLFVVPCGLVVDLGCRIEARVQS